MSKIIQYSTAVEAHVRETGCTYITACLEVAELMEIDEEKIPKHISESLRQKIEIEAIRENTIRADRPGQAEDLTGFI